jgi:hypothetical protein
MFFSKKFLMCVIVAALTAISSTAHADFQSALLSDLIAGGGPNGNGTLIVGDKVFGNFGGFNTTVSGGALAPTAAQITVAGEFGGTSAPGIDFQSAFWSVAGSATNTQSMDTKFTFTVTSLSGQTIGDAEMGLGGAGTRNGGTLHVGETITDGLAKGGSPVGSLLVTNLLPNDHVFFDALHTNLFVQKDFALVAPATGSTDINSAAFASDFDQRFSEQPEPSSVILMGLGVLGMVGYRWRRRGK